MESHFVRQTPDIFLIVIKLRYRLPVREVGRGMRRPKYRTGQTHSAAALKSPKARHAIVVP